MKTPVVLRYVGEVLMLNAFFMFVSALIALFNDFDTGFYPLFLSFLFTTILGYFPLIFVPADQNMSAKEGYLIVVISWILSPLVGMLPYLIWGGEFTITNSWFESMSGYTTTGATILQDVEALPKSLLFWRCTTHWIGGVGVVLFALVILPAIGKTKMTLSSVELSTIAKENFRYTTRTILRIILFTYCGLTFAETILLKIAGMDWFDAVCHSFSTLATGGFSTKNLSIMYYDNVWIEIVIMVFMVAGGTHFGLIYSSIVGKRNNLWRSEVVRYYYILLIACSILVAANLISNNIYTTIPEALRYSTFQVISYSSTTGFASANDAMWPSLSILIMTFLAIQCAMAGSTSGGMKADRVILLFKSLRAKVLTLQHPKAVVRIKLSGTAQEDTAVNGAILLITFYILCLFVSTLFLTFWDLDILTSFTTTVAAIGNVGPGFGRVSNLENMSFFNDIQKLWITFIMLFGRLELFGLIHLFFLRSWK
ncbi:Potassium uptake protein TrkH [Mucinivorans hirudinis]|uniref:Potassium uptake protein TrkH n=1 Tax=Mucinivorans hirudinis TaxID=1433126 RepID=A0A060RDW0_9BACT|nr:Potassium uptake protein TrkH [Mucinivorans hirudinis]